MGPHVIIERGGTMTTKEYIKTLANYFILHYKDMVQKYSLDVIM
jgi:hypothetical protein